MPTTRLHATLALLGAAGLLACDEASTGIGRGLDSALVTPAVAAHLDSRGFFPEQQPEAGYAVTRTRSDAVSIARDFVAANAATDAIWWRGQHGGPIDAGRLRTCGRTQYASSAYVPAAMTTTQPLRISAVGYFSVTFCAPDGTPQIEVTVPVEPNQLVGVTPSRFDGVLASAIPIELRYQPALSAEDAVRIAVARTGRRVSGIPELVTARFTYEPARWRVPLESAVTVYGLETGITDTLDFVMVGVHRLTDPTAWAPRALRPSRRATEAERVDTLVVDSSDPATWFTVRLGMPRGVEAFVLATPSVP